MVTQLVLTFPEPVERCPVCVAVHPCPAVFFGQRAGLAPCSSCGTAWSDATCVEPFVARQRSQLQAHGWAWSGTDLAPPVVQP